LPLGGLFVLCDQQLAWTVSGGYLLAVNISTLLGRSISFAFYHWQSRTTYADFLRNTLCKAWRTGSDLVGWMLIVERLLNHADLCKRSAITMHPVSTLLASGEDLERTNLIARGGVLLRADVE